MNINLVFDVETLGIYENAVVLSIACVPFEFENPLSFEEYIEKGFHVKFSVREQIEKYKREVDQDVIHWWKKQDPKIRQEVIHPRSDDVSLFDGCLSLRNYIENSDYDFKNSFSWSRGIYFDIPKIESLYRLVDIPMPFNTWKSRDIRTMIDVLTGSDDGYGNYKNLNIPGVKCHNALHDAAMDACRMIKIFQDLSRNDEIF